jgi:hypothetical protein
VIGRFASGGNEYLANYPAIIETKLGEGRIILLGAQPSDRDFAELLAGFAAECGIFPVADGSPNVDAVLRCGEWGSLLCLIECMGKAGELTLPFAGSDMFSGKQYAAGEKLSLAPYECLFLKKED